MGCWNSTCALSNLPIIEGENVKAVILFEGWNPKFKSGSCNADDILCPAFLPLTGKYDDYGGVEDIVEDLNYSLVLKFLKNLLGNELILDRGDEVNSDWNIQDFLRGIERGVIKHKTRKLSDNRFSLSNNNQTEEWNESNFSFVMIREDIYNFFIEESKNLKNFHGETRIDRYQRKIEENLSFLDSDDIHVRWKFDLLGLNLARLVGFVVYSNFIREGKEGIKEILDLWVEFSVIKLMMEDLRLIWLPSSGQGSQDTDWDLHKKLSEKKIEICNSKLQEELDWE